MLVRSQLIVVTLVLVAGVATAQTPDSEIDRALERKDFRWRSIAEDEVRLFYQEGSFAERHRIMLLRGARAALTAGLVFLEMADDGRQLRVLYVDDRGQMEKLIGRPYAGYADWSGHGVFLVCNAEWRSFDTHEISHVLSFGRWGDPAAASSWMIEALPIAIDGWCQTADIDDIAAFLTATGRWPGLAAYTEDHAALGEIAGGVLGASLVRHMQLRYGAAIIAAAWRSGLTTALMAEELDPGQVEQDWLESLRGRPDPLNEEEWQILDADGCG